MLVMPNTMTGRRNQAICVSTNVYIYMYLVPRGALRQKKQVHARGRTERRPKNIESSATRSRESAHTGDGHRRHRGESQRRNAHGEVEDRVHDT